MPALGGLMTYLHDDRFSSIAPTTSTASRSSHPSPFLYPGTEHSQHAAPHQQHLQGYTNSSPARRHRPLTSSSSSSSDFSVESPTTAVHHHSSSNTNSNHVVLPPLSQHLSQPMKQASAYPSMSFVSHQCPVAQQALALQNGSMCGYCRNMVQSQSYPPPQQQQQQMHQHQQQQQQHWPYSPPQQSTSTYPPPPSSSSSSPPPPSAATGQAAYYTAASGHGRTMSVPHQGSNAQYNGLQTAASYEYAVAHTNTQNQCPHCGRVLGRPADLERHIESVHIRAHQFPCTYATCDRRSRPFNRWDHLRDHLRKVHGEQIAKTRGPRNSRNAS